MSEFVALCFSGTNFVPSLFLAMLTCYWLLVIAGVVAQEWFDLDLDVDADGTPDYDGLFGIGVLGARSLNLGRVPTMLWLSVMGLGWWCASLLLDSPSVDRSAGAEAAVLLRNLAIGVGIAKLATQPLRGKFAPVESRRASRLVGAKVTITSEATTRIGQALCPAEGAPLLLNVRVDTGVLEKGARARLVAYDRTTRMFLVERCGKDE